MLLADPCCKAQSKNKYIIRSTRLTVEDGLISNFALCGVQDSRGFIWIGSTEGLQRYDGKRFTLFNKAVSGLQANKVGFITEDRDGMLWLLFGSSEERLAGAGWGVDLIDLHTYKVKTLQESFAAALPFPAAELKWIFSDEQHNLFLITMGDAVWWYKGKGVFRRLLAGGRQYSFFPHNSLYHAAHGDIWLSADSSVIHLDTLGHFSEAAYAGWPDLNVLRILPNGDCIAMARKSALGIAGDKPRFAVINRQGHITPALFNLFPPAMRAKNKDYLIEYRGDARSRNVIVHNPDIGLQLITDSATIQLIDTAALTLEAPLSPYSYFTDRGGGHWLCSSLGVYRFQVAPAHFTNYLTRQQLPAATAVGNQARGIWTDGDDKYIARDGLFRVSDSGKRITCITPMHPILLQGDSNFRWFSTSYGSAKGVYRIRRATGAIAQLFFEGDEQQEIWTLYQSRGGIRYAGGSKFLGYVRDNKVIPLTPSGDSALKGTCYQLVEDNGGLFAITDDGLFEIKGTSYYRVPLPLPGKRFHHLFRDQNDIWWLCTGGDGLIRWDRNMGTYKQFLIEDGLSSNVLYGLLGDAHGLFWISSNNGLIRFNPATLSIKTFTKKDGLPDNEFNRGSFFKASDGQFYFGGLNGVTAFNPAEIPEHTGELFNAPLQLILVQGYSEVQGSMVDKMPAFVGSGSITLAPGDKFITLEVALLDYAPGAHHYEYRLEGLSNSWISSGDGMIRLDNLPYGNYTLHIRGQAAAGAWSLEELHIPLKINAPLYIKPWFILCVVLLLLITLWAGIRGRLQLLKRANRRLEKVVGKRTQELSESLLQKDVLIREIHHRVKNNLQVISALQQLQSARSNDPQVKAALEESQNRVLSIAFIHHNLYQHDDLKGVEMQSFIKELTEHIAAVYAQPDQQIKIVCDTVPLSLDIDTAVPIGLIINELLTNSYKYAFEGRIAGRISISLQTIPGATGSYLLHYTDDGPGLPEGTDWKRAKSLGLRLITQLSRQLDGELTYNSHVGSGFRLLFHNFELRNQE